VEKLQSYAQATREGVESLGGDLGVLDEGSEDFD